MTCSRPEALCDLALCGQCDMGGFLLHIADRVRNVVGAIFDEQDLHDFSHCEFALLVYRLCGKNYAVSVSFS